MAVKISRISPQQTLMLILKRCASSFSKIHPHGCEKERLVIPQDVPKGHLPVYVGDERSRYIIPISLLAHPEFQCLLEKAEEVYGFNLDMDFTIPCDAAVFNSLISRLMV